MSEIGNLRALNWELSKHLAIQQKLLRTLGVLCLVKLSSSPDDVRKLADLWHQLIDGDETTSATPELLKEEEGEFARQYVDALATIAVIRKESGDRHPAKVAFHVCFVASHGSHKITIRLAHQCGVRVTL